MKLKEGIPKNDDSQLLGTKKESFKNDISVVFNFLPHYFLYNAEKSVNGRGTRGRGSWLGGRPLMKSTTWNQMQAYQV